MCASFFAMSKGARNEREKSGVLQGTSELMVLKALHAIGPQHGFEIARRIEQVSEGVLDLNEGTAYRALLKTTATGMDYVKVGTSENNLRARFYSITKQGAKELEHETENWERVLKLER